ncbi:protein-tyrosine phosphatase [Microbacterium sp. ZKA21]|uniref:tyrosine-protein phosphatase n=1 Tax=Microbacterium sp. ZKA21 TaxID=3381694 RepID=UPI003D209F6E
MSVVEGAPVRRHVTPGVYNLRDTGGYRAATGTSRWGKLFRSDALHLLDAAGRDLIADLGIAHIVDLRGDDELRSAPSALDGVAVHVHHLPVFDQAAPASQADMRLGLAPIYDHMVDARGAQLADAVRVIAAAEDDEAVLVHCTAGKDRTGLVIAFALSAAGVDRDEVVADYAQTAENLRGEWAERMLAGFRDGGAELTPEVIELVTASPAEVLDALLARVEREHGSVRAYLRANGLSAPDLDRLTAVLVD